MSYTKAFMLDDPSDLWIDLPDVIYRLGLPLEWAELPYDEITELINGGRLPPAISSGLWYAPDVDEWLLNYSDEPEDLPLEDEDLVTGHQDLPDDGWF